MIHPYCGLSVIFCGFISHLIGRETINIPEIFSSVHGFMGKTVKRKPIFLASLRSSKKVLSKSILTRLFVLKNNRTKAQKVLREGRKGNCPHVLLSGRLLAAQGILVVLCTGSYRRHRHQWVMYMCRHPTDPHKCLLNRGCLLKSGSDILSNSRLST